jgi:hypothetical protein
MGGRITQKRLDYYLAITVRLLRIVSKKREFLEGNVEMGQ